METSAGYDGRGGRVRAFFTAFNKRLAYAWLMIVFSAINFGMDQGAFNSTVAMTYFVQKFGTYHPDTKTYALSARFLSMLNSIPYLGCIVGLLTGNLVSRTRGRKAGLALMCCWAIVSPIVLCTAETQGQILAGRIIAYGYIGTTTALVPVFLAELVPARVRGFIVGTYQSGLLVGQLIQALICFRTAQIDSNESWKIPFYLFFIVPVVLACGLYWIPESPRWLLSKGRKEDALKSLRLLRRGAFTDDEIEVEMQGIQTTIDLTVDRGNFKELFQGTNLKRTAIAVGAEVFVQLTGQNFSTNYGTYFINSLGTINPFAMTCVNIAVNIFMTLFTQLLTDHTGRVPLMIAGASLQCASLMTMGALGTVKHPGLGIKAGITAMVTVFGAGFQLGWAPLSHVVASEVPTTRLRDMTYAFGASLDILVQWVITFSIPYLLDDIGSKMGFVFGVTSLAAVVFSAFGIPECRGKTLEDIDDLFLEGVPIRKFRTTRSRLHTEYIESKIKDGDMPTAIQVDMVDAA